MALPITIPNTFATETTNIPLSDLDQNFTTVANAINGISAGTEELANLNVAGNVGIGTSNPSGKLHVVETGAASNLKAELNTLKGQ